MFRPYIALAFTLGLCAAMAPHGPSTVSQAQEQAAPEFKNKLSGPALVNALRSGGYVVYFRHGQTEADYADQVFARLGFCSTQRVLSETGWQQARSIGSAFQRLGIPVGEVISSEYCRAWQTADLAFGKYRKTPALNFQPAEEYTAAQIETMRRGVVPLISTVPPRGTNTVVVGHDDPFEAATGIYPEPQGVAFVVKPLGGGKFDLMAQIKVEDWKNLQR